MNQASHLVSNHDSESSIDISSLPSRSGTGRSTRLNQQNSETSNFSEEDDDSQWTETTAPIPNFGFDQSSNRLKINVPHDATPLQMFEFLFTSDILIYVVECPNIYGESLAQGTNRPKARNRWDATFRPVDNRK